MKISNIAIKNFKSFKDASVDLTNFNTIIGESASGKSNFIEAFKFLKDIYEDYKNGMGIHSHNLMQNINLKSPTDIKVIFKEDSQSMGIKIPNRFNKGNKTRIYYNAIEYEICIDFKNNEEIISELVKLNYSIKDDDSNDIYQNSIFLKNNNGHIDVTFKNEEYIEEEFFVPEALLNIVNNNFKEEKGLLINSTLSSVPIPWSNHIKLFEFYNLDPKFSKISPNSRNDMLFEHGDNLTYFLEKIPYDKINLNFISADEKKMIDNVIDIAYLLSIDNFHYLKEYC